MKLILLAACIVGALWALGFLLALLHVNGLRRFGRESQRQYEQERDE